MLDVFQIITTVYQILIVKRELALMSFPGIA